MALSVIGMSHLTAPVEVREQFALPEDLARQLLRAFHAENTFEEALILDTCNRTEVYAVSGEREGAMDYLLGHIARLKGAGAVTDTSRFYHHQGIAAVDHLFHVAAALNSQIVGEHQILGQVKDAYRLALEERMARFFLNKVLHWAFRVGKTVQSKTDLGRGSVSVAKAAVDLAGQIFASLADKSVMLVGAGQTAELAARALIRANVGRVVVANRTLSRAQDVASGLLAPSPSDEVEIPDDLGADEPDAVAQCPAVLRSRDGRGADGAPDPQSHQLLTQAIQLAEIPRVIGEVDLVICSTASPELVLTREDVGEAIGRSGRSVFIVDIAVPRDVDPELGRLDNVFLYNMNDLDSIVARNVDRRRQEIPKAEAIVEYEVQQFARWLDSLAVTPTIKLLRQRLAVLQQAEVDRYGRKFASDDREQLEQFTRGLCNKIAHPPIAFLRGLADAGGDSDRLAAVDIIRKMFELDELEEQS